MYKGKIVLKNLTEEELKDFLVSIGEKKFRGSQIYSWLYRNIRDFDEMNNIPKSLRAKLEEHAIIGNIEKDLRLDSKIDGTKKYLFKLNDGNIIETVAMDYDTRLTLCVSNQVGCRMGCRFCASTIDGLSRNLEAWEILDQIIKVQEDLGKRVSNIVMMGSGEPLDNYENSMANALMYYYRDKNFVFRCINRLDRDTTGLTVVAKHFLSAGILNTFMQRREIKRVYNAIVEDDGSLKESGTVDAPIAREDNTLIKRRVSSEGQRAITHYKVLKRLRGASLIELRLDTGRTHQIRVHMSYIGHPLVGDYLYNERYYDKENVRPLLHSKSLSFTHPITGENLYIECELPKDFKERIDEYV